MDLIYSHIRSKPKEKKKKHPTNSRVTCRIRLTTDARVYHIRYIFEDEKKTKVKDEKEKEGKGWKDELSTDVYVSDIGNDK